MYTLLQLRAFIAPCPFTEGKCIYISFRGNWWIGNSERLYASGRINETWPENPDVAAWRESLKTHVLSLLLRGDLTRGCTDHLGILPSALS